MTRLIELRPAGDRAILIEVADPTLIASLSSACRERWGDLLAEIVPGACTLLLVWSSPLHSSEKLRDEIEGLIEVARVDVEPRRLRIPVRYDGPDLEFVARTVGLSGSEVVDLHRARRYRVAFMGFAPGFGYLVGGDEKLQIPRRARPRESVPAGSVAIAAAYSGVYPTDAPGGWHIIGRTDLVMFDPHRDPPALIEPGDRIEFAAV